MVNICNKRVEFSFLVQRVIKQIETIVNVNAIQKDLVMLICFGKLLYTVKILKVLTILIKLLKLVANCTGYKM